VTGPFDILGVPATGELTDDDVRSAWRRIAAATHPDREDGGDAAEFAAAAAAYTVLRTAASRREVLTDLAGTASGRVPNGPVPRKIRLASAAATIQWRIRHGRPARFALRLLAGVTAEALAVIGVGWQPASIAIIAGVLTWLLLTARSDLAGPP
jgi:hypothetical protein